jgi:hypothetical protein
LIQEVFSTRSNCDREYENSPKPSCQENLPWNHRFLFIHSLLSVLMSRTWSEIAWTGFKPMRTWMWSGVPFIAPERGLCVFAIYKHLAPLERGIVRGRFLQTYRSSGAGIVRVRDLQTSRSSGARDRARSLSTNISLLRSGDCACSRSTNISLLWSEGSCAVAFYKHITPPERGLCVFAFYKHIAPPERGIMRVRVLQTYRSSGARDYACSRSTNISLLRRGKVRDWLLQT